MSSIHSVPNSELAKKFKITRIQAANIIYNTIILALYYQHIDNWCL